MNGYRFHQQIRIEAKMEQYERSFNLSQFNQIILVLSSSHSNRDCSFFTHPVHMARLSLSLLVNQCKIYFVTLCFIKSRYLSDDRNEISSKIHGGSNPILETYGWMSSESKKW